jgi:hypothetical protein
MGAGVPLGIAAPPPPPQKGGQTGGGNEDILEVSSVLMPTIEEKERPLVSPVNCR